MDPRDPRSLPWRSSNYEVLDWLGHHGACEVFRGRHLETRAEVAIKLLRNAPAHSPEVRERFLHEAQLLARIHNPSVVAVLEVGELDDGTYYLVSELVDGEPLSRHLRAGPLPVMRALRLARQLAVGLRCIHEAGAILCDVKPSIVTLVANERDPDGCQVKIVDVSLAEFRDRIDGSEKPRDVIGTPSYMSPEQIRCDEGLDARSDIYGFGVVLYEMLSRRRPFASQSVAELLEAHLNQLPRSLRGTVDVSAEIDALVLGCLAKTAEDRPPDMAHVIAVLDRTIEAGSAAGNGSSPPVLPQ